MTGNSFYFPWEVSLIEGLQNTLGAFGGTLAKILSTIGGETFSMVVLLFVLFCWSKERGKRASLTMLTASLWFPMIKNVVLRIRPYMEHQTITALQLPERDAGAMDIVQQGYSFPSGHSAMSASMYVSIALEVKKRWMWFLAIAICILIGFSRFLAGVHYPTDVLAGWAVGILAIGFCVLLQKYVQKEWVRNVIVLSIGLTGLFWCRSRDYYSALGIMIGYTIAAPIEEKYIGFTDTRKPLSAVLRIAGVMLIYFILNTLMKMPFSNEFLDSGTFGANMIRTARYAIIMVISLGIYPRAFPLYDRIGKKDHNQKSDQQRFSAL